MGNSQAISEGRYFKQPTYVYTSAYTGDYSELVYLRARFYAPSMGRLLTRDTWSGDYGKPISFNRWVYGYGNPVRYTDPSGHCPVGMVQGPDGSCTFTFPELVLYPLGITIGGWTISLPWCNDQTTTGQQILATPTGTPQPYTSTPQSQAQLTAQVTATATVTPSPGVHQVTVYKGIKATNPGEFKNFSPAQTIQGTPDPGGYSAFEEFYPGSAYKYFLPFRITYTGAKADGVRGSVVGIELDSNNSYFTAGVAVYTPLLGKLDNPPIGRDHWSIFVGGDVSILKDILSQYAKDYVSQLKK